MESRHEILDEGRKAAKRRDSDATGLSSSCSDLCAPTILTKLWLADKASLVPWIGKMTPLCFSSVNCCQMSASRCQKGSQVLYIKSIPFLPQRLKAFPALKEVITLKTRVPTHPWLPDAWFPVTWRRYFLTLLGSPPLSPKPVWNSPPHPSSSSSRNFSYSHLSSVSQPGRGCRA